jgi:hypothetical protein
MKLLRAGSSSARWKRNRGNTGNSISRSLCRTSAPGSRPPCVQGAGVEEEGRGPRSVLVFDRTANWSLEDADCASASLTDSESALASATRIADSLAVRAGDVDDRRQLPFGNRSGPLFGTLMERDVQILLYTKRLERGRFLWPSSADSYAPQLK